MSVPESTPEESDDSQHPDKTGRFLDFLDGFDQELSPLFIRFVTNINLRKEETERASLFPVSLGREDRTRLVVSLLR